MVRLQAAGMLERDVRAAQAQFDGAAE